MATYYNEIDPFAAAWLRELIKAGHIAPGEVDERSIEDVTPNDLLGFTQCHFFAGTGVWSYALRQAGWPDDRPVWTGSCPCQPFSSAGKGKGFADERHIWPAFFHLVEQCRPITVFGEQVASKDGLTWLDLVQADLERTGYTVGAVDSCAAGFGAPHLRQRLYWVADANRERFDGESVLLQRGGSQQESIETSGIGAIGHMADSEGEQLTRPVQKPNGKPDSRGKGIAPGRCGDAQRPGPVNGFWRDADWLFCRDGKWRAVEPGTFPLADGATNRVGRLRGYGNAIVAPQAQAFIGAFMEVTGCNS